MNYSGKVPAWIAIPLMAMFGIAYIASAETIVIEVTEKSAGWDRPLHSFHGERSNYNFLVHTPGETLKVDWALLTGDLRSAERWSRLKAGTTYRVKVAGWRVGYFNWYRNIISIERECSLPRDCA